MAIFAGEGGLVRETLLGVGKHLGKDLNLENKSIPGGAREKHPRPRECKSSELGTAWRAEGPDGRCASRGAIQREGSRSGSELRAWRLGVPHSPVPGEKHLNRWVEMDRAFFKVSRVGQTSGPGRREPTYLQSSVTGCAAAPWWPRRS